MPQHRAAVGGPHELGQNLLVDRRFPAAMADILRHAPPLPIVELGAGSGAITRALLALGRPVTAVEIDPRHAARLRRTVGPGVEVVVADLLRYDHGTVAHDVVSNVPFAITTPLLRHLLSGRHWRTAVLLVQWEVARKRAAVGGTTLLTAAWWPWYEFSLGPRVPAAAFDPRPSVDGGILVIRRREQPLLETGEPVAYQAFVRRVFTGRGRGMAEILRPSLPAPGLRRWLAADPARARQLPRDLDAAAWAAAFRARRPDGRARA